MWLVQLASNLNNNHNNNELLRALKTKANDFKSHAIIYICVYVYRITTVADPKTNKAR